MQHVVTMLTLFQRKKGGQTDTLGFFSPLIYHSWWESDNWKSILVFGKFFYIKIEEMIP